MLGFGLITAAQAVKPPFQAPNFEGYPGYPDAVRLFVGFEGNEIHQSDASYLVQFWTYYVDEAEPVDETELFPQPIRVQVSIRSEGGEWCEIELSRNAIGNGHLGEHWVGPVYIWYAYFEPGSFDVGFYETHLEYTCKNPDNPSGRMYCWDTDPESDTYLMDLNFYGSLNVLEG